MNAAGAGGNTALADVRLAAVLAALSGVATFSLIPIAPITLPATDEGSDRSFVARRTTRPCSRKFPSRVPNARSTWAAVPDAEIVMWSLDTAPTVKPWLRSQLRAVLISAADGENLASH